MATGSSKAASPNTELGLKALYEALYEIRSKYASFGIQLGLEKSEIDDIEAQKGDPGRYLLEILSICLKRAKPLRDWGNIQITSFLSMERVALPSKTTCTDFLLELDNILKTNTTLEEMKIQSGLFLPLSAGKGREYCQWTGLGPLQQFNVRAVGSGRSPNLRRSFSSSDLTQPQTLLFWDRQLIYGYIKVDEVDFKKLFSLKKEKGQKLFSLPSFTAPDTEVLQSFSGLDPRLKECLEISDLNEYVEWLRKTCQGMMYDLSKYTRKHSASRAPHSSQY